MVVLTRIDLADSRGGGRRRVGAAVEDQVGAVAQGLGFPAPCGRVPGEHGQPGEQVVAELDDPSHLTALLSVSDMA